MSDIKKNIERHYWVDALKCLGIIAIYLGHFGENAGNFYLYVFSYHVPLFFFASGFFANSSTDLSPFSFIIKKAKALLVPYFVFSFIYLLVTIIDQNLKPNEIVILVKQVFLGIRNNIPAGGLWFLPCLFVINIFFYTAKKILKKSFLILLLSTALFYISIYLLPNNPGNTPSLFFNIDSAFYYMYYYVIGSIVFPFLVKVFKKKDEKLVRFVLFFIFIIVALLSSCIFFKKTQIFVYFYGFLPKIVSYSFSAIIGIAFNILLSFQLSSLTVLRKYGKHSIFLCGFESTSKIIISRFTLLFGLSLTIATPLTAFIYTLLLFIIIEKLFTPLVCKIFPSIKG